MKTFFGFLVLFLAMSCWTNVARADLDQMCLKRCIANGGSSSNCVASCAYNVPSSTTVAPAAKAEAKDSLSPHRILSAPQPTNNAFITGRKPAVAAPEKDYACFSQCLNLGSSYRMCEERCTKPACPPGGILCRRTTGAVNSAVNPSSR